MAISWPYNIYVPFIKLILLLVLSVHDHRVAVGIALAHWGKALLLSNQISLIYKIKDHSNSNPQCTFVSLQLQNVVISNEATLPLTTRLETAYFAIYTHGNATVPVNKWCRANPSPADNQWQHLTPASLHYSYDDPPPQSSSPLIISCLSNIHLCVIHQSYQFMVRRVTASIALTHWGWD